MAGGLNLYGFAGGDPVNFSDPFGLCKGPKGEDLPPEQCRDQTAAEGSAAVARARLLNEVIKKQGITYILNQWNQTVRLYQRLSK